jgi:hypothetical protein
VRRPAALLVVLAMGLGGCSGDHGSGTKAETLVPNPKVSVVADGKLDAAEMSKLVNTVKGLDGVFQVSGQVDGRTLEVALESYDPDPQKIIDRIRKVDGVTAARYVPVEEFTVSVSDDLRSPERDLLLQQMSAVAGIVEVKDEGGIIVVRLTPSAQDVPQIAADLADLHGVLRVEP